MYIRGPWEMLEYEFKVAHSYYFFFLVRISEEILEFREKKIPNLLANVKSEWLHTFHNSFWPKLL